jgi:hypothetical protein
MNNASELMLKPDAADPEQNEEFYRVLGKPEEFAGYENPEGTSLEADTEAEIREILHGADLTNTQYQRVIKEFSDRASQTTETTTQLHTDDMKALAGKWGLTHEDRIEAAKKANDEFFPGRDFENLNGADIEGLFNISKAMTGKGPQAANQPGNVSDTLTPQEATRRAAEIEKRVFSADSDLNAQEKIKLMEKVVELRVMAGGVASLDSLRAGL